MKQESTHIDQRKLLTVHEAHLICLSDTYDPVHNQQGHVNFGYAKNGTIIEKTTSYLPSYIESSDCGYGNFTGTQFMVEYFNNGLSYRLQETIVLHNLLSVISTLAYQRKASFQDNGRQGFSLLEALDHAGANLSNKSQSEFHFIVYPSKQRIIQTIANEQKQKIVFILHGKEEVVETENPNIYYTYQAKFADNYVCGVCHSKNPSRFSQYALVYCFYPLSTYLSATFKALKTNHEVNSKLQQQFMNKNRIFTNDIDAYLKMLELDSHYLPNIDNLFFCLGATGCLNNWAYVLFKKGDQIGIDAPFYFFLTYDFAKSGINLSHYDMLQGTLLDRIKQSDSKGEKGYIIVNPHNPTGKVYSPEEITQVCEWAILNPHYHILMNEIYLNSVHSEQIKIISSLSYADKYKNIQVIRGFAKDYGICGFKIGILISCNKNIHQKLRQWKDIITPQPYVLKAIALLLEASKYGQDIYKQSLKGFKKSTQIAYQILQKEAIEYIKPEGAVFIFINLNSYLLSNPEQNENSVWQRLFYDYKVSTARGAAFYMKQAGFYRLSFVIHEDTLKQGLRRIGQMVKGIPFKSQGKKESDP